MYYYILACQPRPWHASWLTCLKPVVPDDRRIAPDRLAPTYCGDILSKISAASPYFFRNTCWFSTADLSRQTRNIECGVDGHLVIMSVVLRGSSLMSTCSTYVLDLCISVERWVTDRSHVERNKVLSLMLSTRGCMAVDHHPEIDWGGGSVWLWYTYAVLLKFLPAVYYVNLAISYMGLIRKACTRLPATI